MSEVRVAGFSVSIDGLGAGPEQSLQDPLGKRGGELHGAGCHRVASSTSMPCCGAPS